jgi:glucosamine--fructose-6-phosphate aminotransferase (isomerizing)
MTNRTFDGPDEMGREIAGAPEVVEAAMAEIDRQAPALAGLLAGSTRTVLLGTGMSLAVATAVAPAWRRSGRSDSERSVVVRESTAAALGSDDGRIWRRGDLVVAISKSGTSPETVAAARHAVAGGATVVAVTAVPGSPLAETASLVVATPIGEELGAGTRSASAAFAALLGICAALDCGPASREETAAALRLVVESWATIAPIGTSLAAAERLWIVGFGSGIGLADAAAIMWHEKVHRPAVALSVSEFRHGPIEAARSGDAVIVVDPDKSVAERTAYLSRLLVELTSMGVGVTWLAPAPPEGVKAIPLAASPGPRASIEALVRLQQLARSTAHAAGTYRDGFDILHSIVTPATEL